MTNTSIIKGLAERIEREAPAVPEGWKDTQSAAYRAICEALEPLGFGLLSRNPTGVQIAEVVAGLRDVFSAPQQAPQAAQPVQPSETEKLMDAAGLCRRCAATKE